MGENITVNQKVTGISGDIRELQLALEKLGYLDTEGYYGYYGEKTLRAVNKYKEDHNLDNKGVNYGKVGKSTLESIEKELENKQKKDYTIKDSKELQEAIKRYQNKGESIGPAKSNITYQEVPLSDTERSYLEKSLNQIIKGNYTDDVTALGTGGQVVLGVFGLDTLTDIRDLTADINQWEWSKEHIAQTALDALGLSPGLGIVKYGDEIFEVIKIAGKNFDQLILVSALAAKHSDEVKTAEKAAVKNADKIVEGVGNTVKLSSSNIQHIKKHTFDGMKEQAKYLDDVKLAQKLDGNSFFNPKWTQEQIINNTEKAYNALITQGKTGLQSFNIDGEDIFIFIFIKSDGTFDTAYGTHILTVKDFR